KIPKFKNKEEEKKFWLKNDSSKYLDWSKAERNPKFVNLKPSTKSIDFFPDFFC
ncbi:BrnA antitoxin family protein, partial [Patescibacteria group bacterium]|nr:BrnA antitoxin family protein [Patescibacteria group bacterium]